MDRANRHLAAALRLIMQSLSPPFASFSSVTSNMLRNAALESRPQTLRSGRTLTSQTAFLLSSTYPPSLRTSARHSYGKYLQCYQSQFHRHKHWRCFSSGADAGASEDDVIKAKFVRFFALFMMVAAGFRVFPWVAASSVGNSLGLLAADEPFLLKSGISRLLLVVRMSDSGREKALKGGAVPLVLRLVPHEDMALVDGSLHALEALGESGEGLDAIREAGGEAVLQAFLQNTTKSPLNEDAVYRARTLLQELQKPIPSHREDCMQCSGDLESN